MFKSTRQMMATVTAALLATASPSFKIPGYVKANFTKEKRIRPGTYHKHSSTRQNARIARQLAAGQLDFSSSRF